MNSALLTAVAFALYLTSAVCYGAILFLDSPAAAAPMGKSEASSRPTRYAAPFLIAGIAVLFAAIGLNCAQTHRSPFASEYGTLVVAAWAISIIQLALDRKLRMPALGAASMLTACIVLGFAHAQAHGRISTNPVLGDPIVTIHVLAIISAYALILVASGCGCLYLMQDRLLKRHSNSHMLGHLPPLTSLDTIGYQCVVYAFSLVTLGLGVGVALVMGGGPKKTIAAWFLDPHVVSTAALWLLFTLYLSARLAMGWRGVKLQYILLIGILCAFAAYALPTASAHRF